MVLFLGTEERKMALASVNWPTTIGRIVESYNRLSPSLRDTSTHPMVRYSYTVNGQGYFSGIIAYNPIWIQNHFDATKRFPINTTVQVYYSPDDPDDSCLEIGNTSFWGQWVYWAIACFASAAFFVFAGIKSSQKQGEIRSKSLME